MEKKLRDRLRSLEIKIVDLAKMLNISRPTLYKMIKAYEEGQLGGISPAYIGLFDYVMQRDYLNSNAVLVYISQHILLPSHGGALPFSLVGEDVKSRFIGVLLNSKRFDGLLSYLLSCHELLEKDHLGDDSRAFLLPLRHFYESLGLNLHLKDEA